MALAAVVAFNVDHSGPITQRRYIDKENFVTGHDGTSPLEILILCLVVPVGLALYRGVVPSVARLNRRLTKVGIDRYCILVESMAILFPMLMIQTSLVSSVYGHCALLIGMSILSHSISITPSRRDATGTTKTRSDHIPTATTRHRPLSLSIHRSCLYLMTSIAILAVDFPLFPREYCKTEIGGYGFMDLGASGFVIVSGWTSALSGAGGHGIGAGGGGRRSTTTMGKFARKTAPLLALGIIRLLTTKGLEYQEHVTEYGVHWNFFFTLCCVHGFMVIWKVVRERIMNSVRRCACRYRRASSLSTTAAVATTTTTTTTTAKMGYSILDFVLALSILVPYQTYLTVYGGQAFVENGERRCREYTSSSFGSWSLSICDLFVANREGILGILGYLSVRLLSEVIAVWCVPSYSPPKNDGRRASSSMGRTRIRRLSVASVALWSFHLALSCILNVDNSRRSTNAPFVLWSLAHNVTILCLIEVVLTPSSRPTNGVTMKEGEDERRHDDYDVPNPRILDAVNRHGLAVFLISNVLTGLVNLSVDTLHTSNVMAILILSCYLGVLCGFTLLLDALLRRRKEKVD